jgi:uncharacterized protein (DUF58 family)
MRLAPGGSRRQGPPSSTWPAMQPTARLYGLLLGAAVLAAYGLWGVAGLLAAVALGAAAADWLRSRDLAGVDVQREVAETLSLGAWTTVRLTVRNGTGRALALELRDVYPLGFAVEAPMAAGAPGEGQRPVPGRLAAPLPAGETAEVAYRVRPPRRGHYRFGGLYLRAAGPLGLLRRDRRVDAHRAVRVYPDLRPIRRYELLARRGMAQEAGLRPWRRAGSGTEFARLRDYLPDDDFRRINWKASARSDRPIVNELEAERSQNVLLMVDCGRLMGATVELPAEGAADALTAGELPAGLTKLDHALNAALLLAYVGTRRGDRVGVLAYADEVRRFVPPGRGQAAYLASVEAMAMLDTEPVEPDHGRAFAFLAGRRLRRSLVVLFTDLADREASTELVAQLQRSARHHLAVCVTLSDPTVRAPAEARPRSTQQLYERFVAQRLLDDRQAVLADLTHRGVLCLDTPADQLSPRLIDAYLDLKLRGRI